MNVISGRPRVTLGDRNIWISCMQKRGSYVYIFHREENGAFYFKKK